MNCKKIVLYKQNGTNVLSCKGRLQEQSYHNTEYSILHNTLLHIYDTNKIKCFKIYY